MAAARATSSIDESLERALLGSIEHSPIASVVTAMREPDYPIIAVNQAFCTLTGYAAAEAVGRNCRFLSGPLTDPAARAVLRTTIEQGGSVLTELTNYKKDGTPFQNAVMIAPVLGAAGEIAYYLGSQMDVTDGVSLTTAIRRQRAADRIRALTPRQRQVLEQMIQGYRNKQIAARLGIDEKTVKMHRAGMLAKLEASTSADAIRLGVEAGI
jgi:PAS domain S-box-containing protein